MERGSGRRKRVEAELTGLSLPGLDLLESALNLGVETVLSHDEDDAERKRERRGY